MEILGIEIKAQNEREERLVRMVSERLNKCMEKDRGMPTSIIFNDIRDITAYNECMLALGMVDYMQHSRLDENLSDLHVALWNMRQNAANMNPMLKLEIEKAVRMGEGKHYVGKGEIPSATLKDIKTECDYRELGKWIDFLHPKYDMIIDSGISEKVETAPQPLQGKGKNMGKKEMAYGAHR